LTEKTNNNFYKFNSIKRWREFFFITVKNVKWVKNKKNFKIDKNMLSNFSHLKIKKKSFFKFTFRKIFNNLKLINFTDFLVFRDLWERGFYIYCGVKFGANYIIYSGNIELFHSCVSILILKPFIFFSATDMISFGRVGNSTKKRNLIGSISTNLFTTYFNLKWNNLLP
jgi:tRNA-intron lyase